MRVSEEMESLSVMARSHLQAREQMRVSLWSTKSTEVGKSNNRPASSGNTLVKYIYLVTVGSQCLDS